MKAFKRPLQNHKDVEEYILEERKIKNRCITKKLDNWEISFEEWVARREIVNGMAEYKIYQLYGDDNLIVEFEIDLNMN